MKRREFLKRGAAAVAAAGSVSAPFVTGCSSKAEYDLLIRGGTVFDGTGSPGVRADVAITGGKIVKIAPNIDHYRTVELIDAAGLAVSPGFIDPHTHTSIQLLVNPRAESKIRQGVTLEIGGNCGGSWFPVPDADFEESRENLKAQYDLDFE